MGGYFLKGTSGIQVWICYVCQSDIGMELSSLIEESVVQERDLEIEI